MKPNSIYPVIGTDQIAVSRDFYTSHFDFDIVFEADWYVSLRSRSNPAYELALLDYRHSSLPEAYRQPARGVLINFEVTDVDEIYTQLTEQRTADDTRAEIGGLGAASFYHPGPQWHSHRRDPEYRANRDLCGAV